MEMRGAGIQRRGGSCVSALALTPKVLPSAFVNNRKTVSSRLLGKECADRLKRYYGASPYSGVVVTVSSPGAALPCPCSNNTGAMRPQCRTAGKTGMIAQWVSVPPIAGRMAGIAGRMAGSPPLEPLRGYRQSAVAFSGSTAPAFPCQVFTRSPIIRSLCV